MRATGGILLILFSEKMSVYSEYLIDRADSDVFVTYIIVFLNLRRNFPLNLSREIYVGTSTE
jgi:hypothetical protein